MATAKTENKPAEERVELFVPRTGMKDEPDVFIGINGKSYLLPRGKSSLVPKAVYEEYMRAERAKEKLRATVESRLSKG